MAEKEIDALIIGSGPNGLASAITLARAGCSVRVMEASHTIGGGMRTAELTLPGFKHDIFSAVHPFALAAPFFRSLPLEPSGLEWIHSPAPVAHPLDDGTAVILERSIDATAATMGSDGAMYRALMQPLVRDAEKIIETFLAPLHVPRDPRVLIRFGLPALLSTHALAHLAFRGERARALFAGMAAHSAMPLEHSPTAAFSLMLCLVGHAAGWAFPSGGAQKIADAMARALQAHGGKIVTDSRVDSIDDLPPARAILFDVTPRQLVRIAGHRLPAGYVRALQRYRYGPGAFKVDYALDGPIPWRARDCARAATVHLGGTLNEIAASERAAFRGEHPAKPAVMLTQTSLFDPTRAPRGKHTVWAYCHVPNGSTFDMSARIEAQIERFAPGFRERILARHISSPAALERENANVVGGDVTGGLQDLFQFYTRPTWNFICPYATPLKGVYLCSASTPPGGGVHGMCGYFAAQAALRDVFGVG
ncbi:MAG: NAD(P)/FAD-dependent oxidoreductase [Chloroflexi bacterium]|nr:NAD(P)/FAD-dependent oxidoreductase [Chloroflexota bacterium]